MRTVAQELSRALEARETCRKVMTDGAVEKAWNDRIVQLLDLLPSGSGIDNGTTFDEAESTRKKLVFLVDFHHMDENGYYDGWTEHKVIITPEFDGLAIRVTGVNRNDIKDHLMDLFDVALSAEAPEMLERKGGGDGNGRVCG